MSENKDKKSGKRKSTKCDICKWEFEENIKRPVESKFKDGDIVIGWQKDAGRIEDVVLIGFYKGGCIETCDGIFKPAPGKISHASDDAIKKLLNEFYTQKVGKDWLVRAYDLGNDNIGLYWRRNTYRIGSLFGIDIGTIICTALGVKIMKFKQSKGEYPYPEEVVNS